jgi:hypothetical protein
MLLMLVFHASAQDTRFKRICRSPRLYDVSAPIYKQVAEIMNTTPKILKQVTLLKVENYTHIERVFFGSCHNLIDTDKFEHSKKILSGEILTVLSRNAQAWGEICSD